MTSPAAPVAAPALPPQQQPPAQTAPPARSPVRMALLAILASALTGTASEIFLKMGAVDTELHPHLQPLLGVSGLESKWVWLAIGFTVLSFLAWVRAVRAIPLSIAFTLANVVHVFVPLASWFFLGEIISWRRWCGIALVISGLIVIARPVAHLDEKLERVL